MNLSKKKKEKHPSFKFSPSVSKQPQIASDPIRLYSFPPAWRISTLEMCGPFGWHEVDGETLQYIQKKLASFESMTWAEILVSGKNKNHFIKVVSLIKEARDRLEYLQLDDIDEVCSLRLEGQKRVYGIRHQAALSLLWWDPYHKICPSHKKTYLDLTLPPLVDDS